MHLIVASRCRQAAAPSGSATKPEHGRRSARDGLQQRGESVRAGRWEFGAVGGLAQVREGPECEDGTGGQEDLAQALRVCAFGACVRPAARTMPGSIRPAA
jgi:hypothetical protein